MATVLLYNSCPVIKSPVYATAMEKFRKPRDQNEMLKEICKYHYQLKNISFPTIKDIEIGKLIGAYAFKAMALRKFSTGPSAPPYGVNTMLVWTLIEPILQRSTQNMLA